MVCPMLDICISASLAALTIVMAYLGVHVTLHPPNESPRARRRYKIGFLLCGVAAVFLVITQGVRANKAQRRASGEIADLRQDIGGAKSEAQSAKLEVQSESARRQQAERDLAIIIQASGQATRAGITQDLHKIPLKVEVNGKPADTPERKQIREALGQFVQRGMSLRDRCATDVPVKQLETEAQVWFTEAQIYLTKNLDSSYLSQFLLTHPDPLTPGSVRPEMLPLWHGLNQRVQTLDRFIDELK